MAEPSSVSRWLAGIAAGIISSVVIWALTHPGGVLNRQKQPSLLKILDYTITPAVVGGSAQATITVYNDSNNTGDGCTVAWYSGSEAGRLLRNRGPKDLPPSVDVKTGTYTMIAFSKDFALFPHEKRQISMESRRYTEAGTFIAYFEVACLGGSETGFISALFGHDVTVVPSQ